MKNFKQFMSESVNISGDFNGNLYMNSEPQPQKVGESYVADIMWNGSLHRLEFTAESLPSNKGLAEQLQTEYPGAMVHNIYPAEEKQLNIQNAKRYHPGKLDWI